MNSFGVDDLFSLCTVPSKTNCKFIDDYVLNNITWSVDSYLLKRLFEIEVEYAYNRNLMLCKMGEDYCYYNINYQLRERGLHYSKTIEPFAYWMKSQYRRNKNGKGGQGGIDIYVRLTDESNNTYSCMVEVSNSMKLNYLTDEAYHESIYSKFEEYDRLNRCFHFFATNQKNYLLIKERCDRDGIFVIPIAVHITPEYLHWKYG